MLQHAGALMSCGSGAIPPPTHHKLRHHRPLFCGLCAADCQLRIKKCSIFHSKTMSETATRSSEEEPEKKTEQQQEQQPRPNESPDQQKKTHDQKQNSTSSSSSSSKTKNMDKLLNKVPNLAPEGPLGTQTKGPLSSLGDPLGQALNYTLKPLGHVTGAIGNPHGEALERVQRVAQHEGIADGEPKFLPEQDNGKSDRELPGGERIGGKKQTGENPLGL
ncbi:hypothetical protein BST61_g6323 [Cercospora zeina]